MIHYLSEEQVTYRNPLGILDFIHTATLECLKCPYLIGFWDRKQRFILCELKYCVEDGSCLTAKARSERNHTAFRETRLKIESREKWRALLEPAQSFESWLNARADFPSRFPQSYYFSLFSHWLLLLESEMKRARGIEVEA